MTLMIYCLIVVAAVFLYAIGISIHKEVKETFKDIENEMKKTSSHSIINKESSLSYPFFLANNRAQNVYWVVNGLFSFVALIVLVLWFGTTIFYTIEKGIKFSDPINVIELFGVFGIVQPAIVYIVIAILAYYWLEARSFNKWRKQ